MSTFFDDLERELRRATVRRAAAERAARVLLLRRMPIAATVAAVLLLVAGAVAGTLALAPFGAGTDGDDIRAAWRGLPAETPPPEGWPLTSADAAEPRLIATLGVLRREQRDDDRDTAALRMAGMVLPSDARGRTPHVGGTVLLPSVRRPGEGAWGEVTLLPFRPRATTANANGLSRGAYGDRAVMMLRVNRPGRTSAYAITTSVTPRAEQIRETGWLVGGADGDRAVAAVLVPDGVASVGVRFRGRAAQRLTDGDPGPRASMSRRLVVDDVQRISVVRDNVAVAETRIEQVASPYPRAVVWYDAQGRRIKTVHPSPQRP